MYISLLGRPDSGQPARLRHFLRLSACGKGPSREAAGGLTVRPHSRLIRTSYEASPSRERGLGSVRRRGTKKILGWGCTDAVSLSALRFD